MYRSQMLERQNFKYPPVYRLIRISLKNKDYHLLNDAARYFTDQLRDVLGSRVLGPEYPLVSRVKNLYIKNVLVKFETKASAPKVKEIIAAARDKLQSDQQYRPVRVHIDVDPV